MALKFDSSASTTSRPQALLPNTLFVMIFAIASLLPANSGLADIAQESWSDPNFALCEGMGAAASGRINAYAEYENSGSSITITSLNIVTSGYNFEHVASGNIGYADGSGQARSVILQQPWFSEMGAAGPGDSLFLPQVMTSANGPGPWEQMKIEVSNGTELSIGLSLLFSANGGNCPTSFDTKWKIN